MPNGEKYVPQTKAECIALRLFNLANADELAAIRELLDRAEGSAPKTIKLEVDSDPEDLAKLLRAGGWVKA